MKSKQEILIRVEELAEWLENGAELDEGEQAELAALLWVLNQEERWYKFLQTGEFH